MTTNRPIPPRTRRSAGAEPPPGQRHFTERRADTPRRVRQGVRLRTKDAEIGSNWISKKWLRLLDDAFPTTERHEGLAYARSGQTVSFSVNPGSIEARVQGRASKPYATKIHIPALSAAQWDGVIDAMAAEAIYAAKLPAGELPELVETLFGANGIELVPSSSDTVGVSCSCSVGGNCKHAVAVALLFAEQLNDDPLAICALRGLSGRQLIDRLRQARAIHTSGAAAAHADPMIPESRESPLPLEQCVDAFWRPGERLAELREGPPPAHVHHALLRRLGPSPLSGRFPLVGLLASIYDTVAESAIALRDRAERVDEDAEREAEPSSDQAELDDIP